MKNILTLSVAILSLSASVNAQKQIQLPTAGDLKHTHARMMDMLLHRADNNLAQKTTQLKQRLIGMSSWGQTGPALNDSATYGYTSNTRGSAFNYNLMAYYSSYPALNNFIYEYIASNPERLDIKADSILHYSDNGGIVLTEQQDFSYNASNKVLDYTDNDYSSSPAYQDRYIHTYDGQGRLTLRLNITDGDTSAREFFTYNAQGKLLLDSVEQYDGVNIWTPVAKIAYVYDASSNPTNISLMVDPGTGTMITFITFDNTFYSNNTLKTSAFGINQTGTSVDPIYLDSFGYASGITSYSNYLKEYEYDANTSTWVPYYMQTRHINAQSVPDTLYTSQWDGTQWQPYGKNVYTYNSYNNPVTDKYYTTSATPDNIATYYYEQYNDPTSVGNAPAVAQDIRVFPNPTSGNLSISWSNAVIGAPVTISIVGMNGQMVYSESLRWNQAVQQLSVGQLQPGVYAMIITDQKGQQVFHQNIVKQ